MPSIKDAIEECITDSNSAFKFLALAIPIFIAYKPLFSEAKEWSDIVASFSNYATIDPYWGAISIFIMFGLSLITTHNVINANCTVLPGPNIFSFFFQTVKGLIAIVPIVLIAAIIPVVIITSISKVIADENIINLISFIISTIFYFGIASSYILYSKNYKFRDAYKFKTIFETIIETAMSILFCAIVLGIINYLLFGGITYVFWVFKLMNTPLYAYVFALFQIINVAIFAHCLAQIGYEKIIKEEEKDKLI